MNNIINVVSSGHVGNFYCALIASEAAARTVINTVCAIVSIAKTLFQEGGYASEGDFDEAKDYLLGAGENGLNAAIYGLGALNPIAGVVVPVVGLLSHTRIHSGSEDTDDRPNPCWSFRVINWIPARIAYGIETQIAPLIGDSFSYRLMTISMIGAGFFVLGISPFASLSSYKFFPIRLTLG